MNGKKLYAKVTKSKHKEMANSKLAKCRKSFEKEKPGKYWNEYKLKVDKRKIINIFTKIDDWTRKKLTTST